MRSRPRTEEALAAETMVGVRMVATDLDGTIVRHDYTISERTLAALNACQEAGVLIVFVTGRPPRWMQVISDRTGHAGIAVCANGALVYDLGACRVVEVRPIPLPDVRTMVERLRENLPGSRFAVEKPTGIVMESGFGVHPADRSGPETVAPIDDLLAVEPVVAKLLCRLPAGSGSRMDEWLELARSLVDGLGEAVYSDPGARLLEIGAAGVTKATTLALVAAERGLGPDDVVAFGDMPNDVPMLRWAGRGYAMSSGHPDAIAVADDIAPPCDEDGVAQILEALLSPSELP